MISNNTQRSYLCRCGVLQICHSTLHITNYQFTVQSDSGHFSRCSLLIWNESRYSCHCFIRV